MNTIKKEIIERVDYQLRSDVWEIIEKYFHENELCQKDNRFIISSNNYNKSNSNCVQYQINLPNSGYENKLIFNEEYSIDCIIEDIIDFRVRTFGENIGYRVLKDSDKYLLNKI